MQTQLPAPRAVRKLTRGDLANIQGATLILGCCTQGCCKRPDEPGLVLTAPN